jgi:KaiC/GvpD/RAD55 family RecA-like ATPase
MLLPMGAEDEIRKQLAQFPDRSAVSIVTDIDNYVPVLKGVVGFTSESGTKCIYVTCTIPARVVLEQLADTNINPENVFFIDSISHMVGSSGEDRAQVLFVESPTMLEGIMLKVDTWLKKIKDGKRLVFLDSVSTLAMHNEGPLLSEFLHYFITNLRGRGIRVVVLSVTGQVPEEVETVLRLICDETVILKGEESAGEEKDA